MLFRRNSGLQIDRAYTLEEDGELGCREGMISTLHSEQYLSNTALAKFVAVEGLSPRDFIVFAHMKKLSYSFLVWSRNHDGQGLLLNSDAFDADPQSFINQRIIDFIRAFNPDTLTQFGNPALNQLTDEFAIEQR